MLNHLSGRRQARQPQGGRRPPPEPYVIHRPEPVPHYIRLGHIQDCFLDSAQADSTMAQPDPHIVSQVTTGYSERYAGGMLVIVSQDILPSEEPT